MYSTNTQVKSEWGVWLKRLGWFGFLFFMAKGVMWLTLPVILLVFGMGH